MAIEVKVPVLGESVAEATIGEWLKKPGEAVAADEPIASLETDKVAVEVPSPVAGVMGDYLVQVGDTVEVGAVIATVNDQAGASGSAAPAPSPAPAPAASPAPAPAAAPAPAPATSGSDNGGDQTLSPAVRRAVLEHGIDPASVKGTGKDGRLTKEDVLAAAQAKKDAPAASTSAPAPSAAPAAAGGPDRTEERVKMTRLRQTIAKRLKSAQENAALLTTFNDVDMTAVMEAREAYKDVFAKKHNIKLGFMSFFAKAACLALKDVPAVNARIEGDEIIYNKYVDLSVAVSAPNGLVVPVVRNVESMSFAEVEQAIAGFGKKAKDGALTMADMAGGTFTISNGGVFGSLMSTPIINPPQSAVLGLHRIEERPVAIKGQVVIRPMMYIALSYDHRIIDGREAVTALKIIKDAIEDPMRLLIDL
jgi:2-oxoglutarate dehydrogenase E2 component (dihydrolipoamide succinyltransferase)